MRAKLANVRANVVIAAASILLAASLTAPLQVSAQVKIMPDGQRFDAEYYAENNPDVVNALGTDENILYLHYQTFGKYEGRSPYQLLTDAQIQEKIYALYSSYPQGMPWSNEDYTTYSCPELRTNFLQCAGFAMYISDGVFGENAPYYMLTDATFEYIKPGDVVVFQNPYIYHSVVIISKSEDSVTTVEGNYDGAVNWNNTYYKKGCGRDPKKRMNDILYIIRRQ